MELSKGMQRVLERLAAAYNTDTLHRYHMGELDEMPDEITPEQMLELCIVKYALANFPEIMENN